MQTDCLYESDSLDFLSKIDTGSVDLIATDPPYYKIKRTKWDKQWSTLDAYLLWLERNIIEFKRVLKVEGSLYLFASPRHAAAIEVMVAKHFRVLNQIVWVKQDSAGAEKGIAGGKTRSYTYQSERILFSEQLEADRGYSDLVVDESKRQYQQGDKTRASVFGDYLRSELDRAGVSVRELSAIFPSKSGKTTGRVYNWIGGNHIPSQAQYEIVRSFLNQSGDSFLSKPYPTLKAEYESLRPQFASPARNTGNHKHLRRWFSTEGSFNHSDIWVFNAVRPYRGKHICEKPVPLCNEIILHSSSPGDLVLDVFVGSGNILKSAKLNGRRFLGCEIDPHWVQSAQDNLMGF